MNKKDFFLSIVIGGGVGLFVQPVLTNIDAVATLHSFLPIPIGLVRPFAFLFFLFLAPFALLLASFVARFIPVVYQIAKFAAVGSFNSFLDLGIFNLLAILFGIPIGGSIGFAVKKSISFLIATTNSYFWNKLWTFGDKRKSSAGTIAKFYGITIFNWILNVGVATGVSSLPAIFVDERAWISVIAPVAGIFAGMAGNFLGYKFFVFRDRAPHSAETLGTETLERGEN